MAVFATDSFTDSSGTALESHTPAMGGSWIQVAGSGGAWQIDNANRAMHVSSIASIYKLSDSPPGAEYDVEADFTFLSDTGSFNAHYLCGRLIDANNFYYAGYGDEGTLAQRWFMGKYQGGAFTSLGNSTEAFPTGQTRHVLLEIRDATKKLIVDGVTLITSTDNGLTAAGQVGLRGQNSGGSGFDDNTNGVHLDNFSAKPKFVPRLLRIDMEGGMRQLSGV